MFTEHRKPAPGPRQQMPGQQLFALRFPVLFQQSGGHHQQGADMIFRLVLPWRKNNLVIAHPLAQCQR